MIRRVGLIFGIMCTHLSAVWAQPIQQELPEQIIQSEVVLLSDNKGLAHVKNIQRTDIQMIQPEDLGDVLQRLAGISLKNYGGLGGMKTISVRGLSGSHSAIVLDGFSVQNTQAGQVDLSNLQVENVESIQLIQAGSNSIVLPVSAALMGNSIYIRTFEQTFGRDSVNARFSGKVGSFGLIDSYAAAKLTKEKYFFSVYGKYRQANGRYAYEIDNGDFPIVGQRMNNQLQEISTGIGFGFRFRNASLLSANYHFSQSDKGLPGAVIFYSPIGDQQLFQDGHQANFSYRRHKNDWSLNVYGSLRLDRMHYLDSSYLNAQGYLSQWYFQQQIQQGVTIRKIVGKHSFSFGVEQNYQYLQAETVFEGDPKRIHLKSLLNWQYKVGRKSSWLIFTQMGAEWLKNEVNLVQNQRSALSGIVSFRSNGKKRWLGLPEVTVKRSFRMPSFNELYYNQVGNIHLRPEIANQLTIGSLWEKEYKQLAFQWSVQGFYNLVEDKIVATPTKNTFIWSMQNVGMATIYGTEATLLTSYSFGKWKTSLTVNYTFQRALDHTDETSPTFGHQLPYLPVHTGNARWLIERKQTGISIQTLVQSERFALAQNTNSSRVAGFSLWDAQVFHTFTWKKQTVRLSVMVKNGFNTSYAYVRYFVMPGRNYLISLQYAL